MTRREHKPNISHRGSITILTEETMTPHPRMIQIANPSLDGSALHLTVPRIGLGQRVAVAVVG
jgi:hypothetical protein